MSVCEILAHKSFRSLVRFTRRWELNHISHDGVSLALICDNNFDRLIDTYAELIVSIDSASEGDCAHDHFFLQNLDGSILTCKCGAWK